MSELKKIRLYREDGGEYSTSEARQDDLSGCYYQSIDVDSVIESQSAEIKRINERVRELEEGIKTFFGHVVIECTVDGEFDERLVESYCDYKTRELLKND